VLCNYPFVIAAWKLAPSIVAGDTAVIKPSSLTSLTLLELVKITAEIIPPGVINVVTGKDSTTGNFILNHSGFRKISFTGSTDIGFIVARAASEKIIPATLKLGGKSANIFFPDCPWEKAVEGAVFGVLINQGEDYSSGSRVFVHEDIYHRFLSEVTEKFNNVKVGIPWEEDTIMGPLINDAQLQKVLKLY